MPKQIEKRLDELKDELMMHFDLRMMNLVQQIRATLIAAGVKPKDFIKAFLDEEKMNKFQMDTYAQQALQNKQKGNDVPAMFKKPIPDEKKIQDQDEIDMRAVQAPQAGVGPQPEGQGTPSN